VEVWRRSLWRTIAIIHKAKDSNHCPRARRYRISSGVSNRVSACSACRFIRTSLERACTRDGDRASVGRGGNIGTLENRRYAQKEQIGIVVTMGVLRPRGMGLKHEQIQG